MNTEKEILAAIKCFYEENGKTPTITVFAELYKTHAATIIRKFGSWNSLLKKAGVKANKADKRTDEQIIAWLKTHPAARYQEIPFGIRNRLEERYGSISEARRAVGLTITDWRASSRKPKYEKPINVGRPIEYNEALIIDGLRKLAIKCGRPPKLKDISIKECGFPKSAIFARFGNLNAALNAASLPTTYTHQENNRLFNELECLMVNVKFATNDIPLFYNTEINGEKPSFIYADRYEYVFLKRSDVYKGFTFLKNKNITIWFLVDDSLDEIENMKCMCIVDIAKELENKNPILSKRIISLRKSYDDISRKYIAPIILGNEKQYNEINKENLNG